MFLTDRKLRLCFFYHACIKVTWIELSNHQSLHSNCHIRNAQNKLRELQCPSATKRNFQSFILPNLRKLYKAEEMEFKVRKESQTILEKVFQNYERRGCVRSYQLGSMLKAMRPDLTIEQSDIESIASEFDTNREGKFDLDAFNKIAIRFLVKQARRESDSFIHKHEIYLSDFAEK